MSQLELERVHLDFLRKNLLSTKVALGRANRERSRKKQSRAMSQLNEARGLLWEQVKLVEEMLYGMPRRYLKSVS